MVQGGRCHFMSVCLLCLQTIGTSRFGSFLEFVQQSASQPPVIHSLPKCGGNWLCSVPLFTTPEMAPIVEIRQWKSHRAKPVLATASPDSNGSMFAASENEREDG